MKAWFESIRRSPKTLDLYIKTISIVEALSESVAQLILQIRVGYYGGELSDWVFYVSVTCSSVGILNAVFTFFMNYRELLNILTDVRDTFVQEFRVLPRGAPPPEGNGWAVATAAQIRRNFHVLNDKRPGLGTWCIASLANNMELTISEGNFKLERSGGVRSEHVVYSRTKIK